MSTEKHETLMIRTPRDSLPLALMLVACGGSHATETTPSQEAAPTTAEPTTPPPTAAGVRLREESEIPTPPAPWESMDAQARGAYMASDVLPYMRSLFQEYDAEEYGDFGCVDCHGASMVERNFEMPNPDILALHPSGSSEQQAMVESHPRMVRFMFNHVVPAMRRMIDAPAYDAETGEGFSCYYCHPHAE